MTILVNYEFIFTILMCCEFQVAGIISEHYVKFLPSGDRNLCISLN